MFLAYNVTLYTCFLSLIYVFCIYVPIYVFCQCLFLYIICMFFVYIFCIRPLCMSHIYVLFYTSLMYKSSFWKTVYVYASIYVSIYIYILLPPCFLYTSMCRYVPYICPICIYFLRI